MKRSIAILLLLFCTIVGVYAQPKTEEKLIIEVLRSLQRTNDSLYVSLFPSFDTLVKYAAKSDTALLNKMIVNQQKLMQYDPVSNPEILKDFKVVLKKGKDSGLHWTDMVMARYELERMILKREMAGIEKVFDARMQGYVMVEDMLTRKHFVIALKDVVKVKDKWYGGHVLNVLEAENIDEYYTKLAIERKVDKEKMMKDLYASDEEPEKPVVPPPPKKPESSLAIDTDDDEDEKAKKDKGMLTSDVIERKFYMGTFDKNTKVELYVRGLKGGCPETICAWEAVYRFQDQDEYLKLEVTKEADGTWTFEEPEVGSMDLKVKGSALVGTWMSFKDRTEYDVTLYEKKEISPNKLMKMDEVIETE